MKSKECRLVTTHESVLFPCMHVEPLIVSDVQPATPPTSTRAKKLSTFGITLMLIFYGAFDPDALKHSRAFEPWIIFFFASLFQKCSLILLPDRSSAVHNPLICKYQLYHYTCHFMPAMNAPAATAQREQNFALNQKFLTQMTNTHVPLFGELSCTIPYV